MILPRVGSFAPGGQADTLDLAGPGMLRCWSTGVLFVLLPASSGLLAMLAFCKYFSQTRNVATSRSRVPVRRTTGEVPPDEVDALLDACRALVAISVRSVSAVSDQVDVVQLRILVVIASKKSVSLGEVADATGINLSKASRTCDRLVGRRLVGRDDDPADRRSLRLTLTAAGRRIVRKVMQARRDAIMPMLAAMPAQRRTELVDVLREFTTGVKPESRDLWALGWET